MKKIVHINGNPKRAAVVMLISDKIGLNQKNSRDKEGYYILIRIFIWQCHLTIINIYAPNNRLSKNVNQKN